MVSFLDKLIAIVTQWFQSSASEEPQVDDDLSPELDGLQLLDTSTTLSQYVSKEKQAQRVFTPETFKAWVTCMGITQRTIADATGVSQSSISRFIGGHKTKQCVAEACRLYANSIIKNPSHEFVYADYVRLTAAEYDSAKFSSSDSSTEFIYFEACTTDRIIRILKDTKPDVMPAISQRIPKNAHIIGGLVGVIDETKVADVIGVTVNNRYLKQGGHPEIIETAIHDLTCLVLPTSLSMTTLPSSKLIRAEYGVPGIIIVFLEFDDHDAFTDIATGLCKTFISGTNLFPTVNVYFTKPDTKPTRIE